MVRNILIVPRETAEKIIQDNPHPKMAIISIVSYRKDIFIKGAVKKKLNRIGCNCMTQVYGDWGRTDFNKMRPKPKGVSSVFTRKHRD